MNREDLVGKYEDYLLHQAADLFNLDEGEIQSFASYEGCRNLVYACRQYQDPVILRISYQQDRTLDQIQAEIHFVNFLRENGVRAAKPLASRTGLFVEQILLDDLPIHIACFEKGKGMRVPDNGYRYREGVPIDEYFQNWGRVLGQMHRLAKSYQPISPKVRRPDWYDLHAARLDLDQMLPKALINLGDPIRFLLEKIRGLPKDNQGYGLIHGDFNDGNFTVDYSNSDITVFDFDDSCYFWFAYELASAWEGGIGRVMFSGLKERKAFMDHYMDQVLEGYASENDLADEWLARIPLFIKLIQLEEFLHYVQYFDHRDDLEIQHHLNYLMVCIEQDLPYMGFFDPIFSPNAPFSLEIPR